MSDLARTRHVLAVVAGWHDARGAALDRSGLTGFSARRQWLVDHPVTDWFELSPLELLDRELSARRAEGGRNRFDSRSVPKPRRVHRAIEFTAVQLRIADAALEARRSA